jgi:PIN domain nuclease of toxin-antitoxin system
VRILLDTHIFLWFISGDSKLDETSRELIEDADNERYLSVASIWEITIKSSLGRLDVPLPVSALVRDHVWANAIELLAITPEHLDVLYGLPYHHKDPFDRIMIAQAMHEGLVLLAKDGAFGDYDVQLA